MATGLEASFITNPCVAMISYGGENFVSIEAKHFYHRFPAVCARVYLTFAIIECVRLRKKSVLTFL